MLENTAHPDSDPQASTDSLFWDQKAAGSNPVAPIRESKGFKATAPEQPESPDSTGDSKPAHFLQSTLPSNAPEKPKKKKTPAQKACAARCHRKRREKLAAERAAGIVSADTQGERDRRRTYYIANKAWLNAVRDAHERLYPEKTRARWSVKNAVRGGKLIVGPCGDCGSRFGVQAHHHDYSKPLDVLWKCRSCHAKEDKAHKNFAGVLHAAIEKRKVHELAKQILTERQSRPATPDNARKHLTEPAWNCVLHCGAPSPAPGTEAAR